MFEAIKTDPAIIEITIVLLILVAVALWQKLTRAALVMGIVYVLYLLFIVFTSDTSKAITDEVPSKIPSQKVSQEPTASVLDTSTQPELTIPEVPQVAADSPSVAEIIADTLLVQQTVEVPVEEIQPDVTIVDYDETETPPIEIVKENPIKVLNMAFGTNVVNRRIENVDSLFSLEAQRIYCLTGIRNQNDSKTIYHKWYHEGKLSSKIPLELGRSYNWRTWSYITVNQQRTGEWQVVIEDTLSVRYDSLSFRITNE